MRLPHPLYICCCFFQWWLTAGFAHVSSSFSRRFKLVAIEPQPPLHSGLSSSGIDLSMDPCPLLSYCLFLARHPAVALL